MSKLIEVVSLRNGLGRTTVASILAMKLAELDYKVLAIDNNYKFCDLANYLMVSPEYTVDDIKPFLRSGILEKSTIASMVVNVQKNLDVLSGSHMEYINNTLELGDIEKIKELVDEVYDYILIDSRAGIEHGQVLDLADIVDKVVIVSLPNAYLEQHYKHLIEKLEDEKISKLNLLINKSVVVYNRCSGSIEFDIDKVGNKALEKCKPFKINYSDNIIDFCNGYKYKMDAVNQEEFHNLALEITGIAIEDIKKKPFQIDFSKILNLGGNKA